MDDLRKNVLDPESLEPLPRLSWYRSGSLLSDPSRLQNKAASISSAMSHWSVRWVAKWTPSSHRKPPSSQHRIITPLSESQNSFLSSIIGEIPQDEFVIEACAWYISFLEFKIRESWPTIFRGMLKGINSLDAQNEGLSVVFEILRVVVVEFSRENIALTDLVDQLYNKELLNTTDGERSHAKQLVFIVFGWITALYPPRYDPEPMKLQLINTSLSPALESTKRQSPRRRIKAFETYEQSLEDNDHLDQPLHTLLGTFGRIMPQQNRQTSMMGGHSTPLMAAPPRPDEQWLELSLLCFHTLEKVAFISIEWVDSLSQHLEFDRGTKALKIFRLPSLCLVMASSEKCSPLSQMFWESDDSNMTYTPTDLPNAAEFYKEVILSYRLLFGQDRASHTTLASTSLLPETTDPLLPLLCTQDWESPSARPIYDSIEADDPATQYSPISDFPYLGKKLLDVQRYVRGQKPESVRGLWHDKRDKGAWWAFWAVIIIGGITVLITTVLGIAQLVVGIMQLKYAREQLAQGGFGNGNGG